MGLQSVGIDPESRRPENSCEVAGSDPDGGIGLSRWRSVHHVTTVTEEVPAAENSADSRSAAVTQTATSGMNSTRTGERHAVVLIVKRIRRILQLIGDGSVAGGNLPTMYGWSENPPTSRSVRGKAGRADQGSGRMVISLF